VEPLAVGLVAGLVAVAIAFATRVDAPPLVALAGAIALVAADVAPATLAGALAMFALSSSGRVPALVAVPVGTIGAIAAIALFPRGIDWAIPTLVAITAVTVAADAGSAPRAPDGRDRDLRAAVLVAAVPWLVWLCVPDTEEVLALAGATTPVVVAMWWHRHQVCDRLRWSPLIVIITWGGLQGFRGRPGSIPALWVAVAVAVCWLIGRATAARNRSGPHVPRPVLSWVASLVALVVAAGFARTFGLRAELGATLAPAVAGVAAVAVLQVSAARVAPRR